jgi:hypothetical protein
MLSQPHRHLSTLVDTGRHLSTLTGEELPFLEIKHLACLGYCIVILLYKLAIGAQLTYVDNA